VTADRAEQSRAERAEAGARVGLRRAVCWAVFLAEQVHVAVRTSCLGATLGSGRADGARAQTSPSALRRGMLLVRHLSWWRREAGSAVGCSSWATANDPWRARQVFLSSVLQVEIRHGDAVRRNPPPAPSGARCFRPASSIAQAVTQTRTRANYHHRAVEHISHLLRLPWASWQRSRDARDGMHGNSSL
jgi:hypothetical protein